MLTIDLRKDESIVREQLIKVLGDVANPTTTEPVRAIEIGYECCDGWFVVHVVRQQREYEPGGVWCEADEEVRIPMPHWGVFISEYLGEHAIRVVRVDGSSFICPSVDGDELDEDEIDDDETDYPELFADAVGKMIVSVLLRARSDSLFSEISTHGTIQVVVEDLECSWTWPAYCDLGQVNLV